MKFKKGDIITNGLLDEVYEVIDDKYLNKINNREECLIIKISRDYTIVIGCDVEDLWRIAEDWEKIRANNVANENTIQNFCVVYDPIYGKGYKDGTILDEILKEYNKSNRGPIIVGSENFVMGVRLLCHREKIPWDKVIFFYKACTLRMDKDCKLPAWPEGFCDFFDNCLDELL